MSALLLNFIGAVETGGAAKVQGVSSGYDVVHGKIKPADRPQNKLGKKLTELTIQEVLDWQDSIDRFYYSEAAGLYQVMEDTLRGVPLPRDMMFNENGQDYVGLYLLNRRGFADFLARKITIQKFGDALAMEWASFPVLSSAVIRKDGVARYRGQSYYGDDGKNKALTSPALVEDVLKRVLTEHDAVIADVPVVDLEPEPVAMSFWERVRYFFFGKKEPRMEKLLASVYKPSPDVKARVGGLAGTLVGGLASLITIMLPEVVKTVNPEWQSVAQAGSALILALIGRVTVEAFVYNAPANTKR